MAIPTKTAASKSGPNRKRVTRKQRSGLMFPVPRVSKHMAESNSRNMRSAMAPVFMAAVLETISAKIIDEAVKVATSGKKRVGTLAPRHILCGTKRNGDLAKLTQSSVFQCGILPIAVRAERK